MLAGCATPTRVALEAVGPPSSAVRPDEGTGRLVVHTPREQVTSGEVSYERYTSYNIRKPDGKPFQHVMNFTGPRDERPETVQLPAGQYSVEARAEGVGPVAVPVLIQALKTTEVHLERGWKPDMTGKNNSDLVRLPSGQIVGWRAPVKSAEPLDEHKAARADAIVKVRLVTSPDAVGVLAYALVETVAVIRNNTDQPVRKQFTVGFRDFHKGVPQGVSVIYLKLGKRSDGGTEWLLLED
ncbi:MAG: hypothetical protein HY300_16405 [Verrucomicrobia bacterium]|nr:hypothetical protein [Verrucomicrobiota bacterium]